MKLELPTPIPYVSVVESVRKALGYNPSSDANAMLENLDDGVIYTRSRSEGMQVAGDFGTDGKTLDWLVINLSGNRVYGTEFEICGNRITPEIFKIIQQQYNSQSKK